MAERESAHPTSPFTPGYGRRPLVYGGHEEEIDDLREVFRTLDFGENHSVLISGLRGAGKTAMLTLLQDAARGEGWLVISDDASKGLMDRVMESTIPMLISDLGDGPKRRLKGMGIWEFTAEWEIDSRQREVKPLLRHDLVALSSTIGNRGVLITIDEVSSGKIRLRELATFAREVAFALRDGANVMIVLAGVRVDLDELLKQEHSTFLRRSRDLDFKRLSPGDTMHVLKETSAIGGRAITDDALRRLTQVAQGYPYLIQLVGDYAWRARVTEPRITVDDAEVAFEKGIRAVTDRVISRVYLDLSEVDREFVKAMAVDQGRSRISDIVKRMDRTPQYVQVYKNRLISSGYVEQAGHGWVRFSLPYLDQYIQTLIASDLTDGETDEVDDWAGFPAPEL
ncbi:MAG: hypothetical protein RI885_1067 [Actinomycetota bacterium]|jgi:hypothetical protein